MDLNLQDDKAAVLRRVGVKLIQRLGLIFLPVVIAPWRYYSCSLTQTQRKFSIASFYRYKRGLRSIADNLELKKNQSDSSKDVEEENQSAQFNASNEVPDEIEEIIGYLLNSLRDTETIVRWSAAKG